MEQSLWAGLRERVVATGVVVAVFAAGCATTQQVQVSEQGQARACGFLGRRVCGELQASDAPGRFSSTAVTGDTSVPSLRYVNTAARWTQYKKVLLAPVTFWGGEDSSVSPTDQQQLTNYFYEVLRQQLATQFELVDQPGPGVMSIQVALLDVSTATPGLRTITMIVPQARALATLKYAATGTYAFVGGATAAVRVLDSQTHEVLVAAVDQRVGGGSVKAAAQWQLGDAENAMTAWAQRLTARLGSWTSGTSPT